MLTLMAYKVTIGIFCVFMTLNLDIIVQRKTQLDAQFILSVFRQPLQVSGVSRPIIRRYNRKHTTIGTYYFLYDCLLSWLGSNPTWTNNYQLLYT